MKFLVFLFSLFLFSCVMPADKNGAKLASESEDHAHDYCSLAESWLDCKEDAWEDDNACFTGKFWKEFEQDFRASDLTASEVFEHSSFQRQLIGLDQEINSEFFDKCEDEYDSYYKDSTNERLLKDCYKSIVKDLTGDFKDDICD